LVQILPPPAKSPHRYDSPYERSVNWQESRANSMAKRWPEGRITCEGRQALPARLVGSSLFTHLLERRKTFSQLFDHADFFAQGPARGILSSLRLAREDVGDIR
jgi:hypothetical protein